jgi:hypothetical protein
MGTNLFRTSLSGQLLETGLNSMAYTPEPTGVGFRPRRVTSSYTWPEKMFISDDDRHRVFEVNAGTDGVYGNSNDTQTSFDVAFLDLGPELDAEDVAVDLEVTRNGQLLLVDGLNKRVFIYNPGPDHLFNGRAAQGHDDFVERVVNVANYGAGDPEGIAYNAFNNSVFVLDDPSNKIYELNLDGTLRNTVTLPFKMGSGAGIALAPPSNGSAGMNAYIVDRGVDNDTNQDTFNDGRLYEVAIPGLTGSTTPTNKAPTVDAGPNTSAVRPAAATLSGSVLDDGLPTPPGATTAKWTQISGPGTASFANPNVASTTATFSAPGTYGLQLSGYDGALTSTDTVSVVVTDGGTTNAPPSVNAGPDQTITLPTNTASLAGTVTDPEAQPVTSTWVKASGPGTVTFGNAAAQSTTATFGSAGTYVLTLTGSDGVSSASNDVQVTVNPAPTGGGTVGKQDIPIRASVDDAEQRTSGTMNVSSGDLNLAVDGTVVQTEGMRFTGVNVPKGAIITKAYVQFQVDEVSTGASNVSFFGQASDAPLSFSTAASNISSRAKTAASVSFSFQTWPTLNVRGTAQQTADLSTIIQELVNRGGWATGGAMALIVSGTGERTAESFDGGAAKAPVLHIEWTS